jgi:hypothetical protein
MDLPIEIVYHIIGYIDNIDIRRAFGLYSKIDLTKHRDISFGYKMIRPYNREPMPWLNTEYDEDGNPPQHISTQWSFNVDIYVYLHNLFDSEERKQKKIKNDFYEILLSEVKRSGRDYTTYSGTINRYVPVNHFRIVEPGSQRFVWKQIYVHYERPYLHRISNKRLVL